MSDSDPSVHAAAADEAAVSSMEVPLPKRRVWPFVVVLLLIAAGIAVAVWRSLTAPFPLRVLVAIDVDGYWWEGSAPAAALADEIGESLQNLGFDPVRAGDPETAAILEDADSPDDAARTLRASFVITATIRPEIVTLPIEGGFTEVRIDAPVRVRYIDDASPLAEQTIHTFSGAKENDRALRFAAESAGRHALDVGVPAMLEHPSVQDIVRGNDPGLVDQLSPAMKFVAARAAELKTAAAAYTDLDAARKAEEKAGPITFHSDPDAEDSLLGSGPRGVLVGTGTVWPFYSSTQFELLRNTALETVAWRGLGATAGPTGSGEAQAHDKIVWRGYNSFTYPSVSHVGRPVVMVEDLYGWARALTLVEPGGKVERLRVETERKLSSPKVSPEGAAVAYVDRACRRCLREIVVMDLTSRKEVFRLDADAAANIGDFAWLDDHTLMAVFRRGDPDEGGPTEDAVWRIDVRDQSRAILLSGDDGARFASPAASADGTTVAVLRVDGGAIVTLDVASGETASHPIDGRVSSLALAPDGSRVVFELTTRDSAGTDIAMVELEGSTLTRLTRNSSEDAYPLFSHDGKRVFFEARNPDPVFRRKRTVARIASVAAP